MSEAPSPAGQPPSLIKEAQTLRAGALPGSGLAHTFRALTHRNYRLFWCGQLVSLIGTWMQTVAQAWPVLELTNSALLLGVVGALQFAPVLLFSLFGGVVADRFPKRNLLVGTQTLSMLLAFTLAVLTSTGLVQVWHVMILALGLGLVNAFDMPTRQSFTIEMVGREDLMNAIALNTAIFNGARILGPAIGGLLIGWLGIAICFYLNGASFLAVIAGLLAMSITVIPQRTNSGDSMWLNLKEGLRYTRHSPLILTVICLLAIMAIFGANFMVVMPLLARDTFHLDADGYGYLMAAMGIGSLAGSFYVASARRKPRLTVVLKAAALLGGLEILLGGETIGVAQVAFSLPSTALLVVAAAIIVGLGFAFVLFAATSNSLLQSDIPDELRGRVISVYTTVFAGTTPVGNLVTGAIAHNNGPQAPLLLGGAVCVLAALGAMWLYHPKPMGIEAKGK